jgi:hypothetical protein
LSWQQVAPEGIQPLSQGTWPGSQEPPPKPPEPPLPLDPPEPPEPEQSAEESPLVPFAQQTAESQ